VGGLAETWEDDDEEEDVTAPPIPPNCGANEFETTDPSPPAFVDWELSCCRGVVTGVTDPETFRASAGDVFDVIADPMPELPVPDRPPRPPIGEALPPRPPSPPKPPKPDSGEPL
jgi:hypothetical protein